MKLTTEQRTRLEEARLRQRETKARIKDLAEESKARAAKRLLAELQSRDGKKSV